MTWDSQHVHGLAFTSLNNMDLGDVMYLDMQTISGCMFHQQGDVRQNEVLVENKAKKLGIIMHA